MPGAHEEIELLYRRYAPIAYRRARHLLGNDADAAEVVHDVFTSLLAEPSQFSGRSSLTTFMYSAITHACLNRLRNQRSRARLLRERGPAERDMPAPGSPEIAALLRSCLERMPEELALVSVYYHGEGLTHDDIARLLDCSSRHVGNLVERAQRFLQASEESPV